jgi:Flp pilus assembly pilin Flp
MRLDYGGIRPALPGEDATNMLSTLQTLLRDDSGQAMTEYAILVGSIAFSTIMMLFALGVRIEDAYGRVGRQLDTLLLAQS